MTTADDLVAQARAATGLSDLGSTHVQGVLEAWAQDLDQPVLSDFGRAALRGVAVNNLRNRLQIVDLLNRHPEIADVELPPVVLIAGFARSGTTLLHNLLTCHPHTRALQRWELLRPTPPPTSATWADDPRRGQVQASVEKLRGTALERLHWVNADEPEECPWGFYDGTGLLGGGAGSVMRRWWNYVQENGSAQTFVEHRRLIQLLLWQNPPVAGSVLVLKSPMTTTRLTQFAEAFPQARYVFTHRDPFRAVVSMNAVADAIVAPLCGPGFDDRRREQDVLTMVTRTATAMEIFAAKHPDTVRNVHYADLMADPVRTVTATLAALDLDAGADAGRRIEAFLTHQRAGRMMPPAAYPHPFSAGKVWAEPAIASYRTAFGVRSETQRLVEPNRS